MTSDVTLGLAFLAGFVSFISPCVLPLVPAYVSYMSGRATTAASRGDGRQRFGTFLHGVFFVLGFTLFFVGFGLLTAAASSFLTSIGIDIPTVLTRLGGAAVILFGLYVMKALDPAFRFMLKMSKRWEDQTISALTFTVIIVAAIIGYFYWAFGAEFWQSLVWALILFLAILALFRKPLNEATGVGNFWYRATEKLQTALVMDTRKLDLQRGGKGGYAGSAFMGVVFSAGWTPCIGPVYGAVLTLANDAALEGDSLWPAARLLTAYSLGLGVPFLLTALAFNQATGVMKNLKRHMLTIERVSGALLLVIGVLILTGGLTNLSARFGSEGELGELSLRLETCTAGVAEKRLTFGSYTRCVRGDVPKIGEDRFIQAVNKGGDEIGQPATPRFVFPLDDDLEDIPVGLDVGQRAPDFTVATLDGRELSLSDLRGQAVLVNFWATWCGPCRLEMPGLEQVYQFDRERGFTIVALNFLESPEQVQPFVDEFGLTFIVGLDSDGAVYDDYQVVALPTSYLVDGNGVIVMKHAGAITAQDLFEVLDGFETTDGGDETALNAGG
jgi:cytochrome c-type biogenesis protein